MLSKLIRELFSVFDVSTLEPGGYMVGPVVDNQPELFVAVEPVAVGKGVDQIVGLAFPFQLGSDLVVAQPADVTIGGVEGGALPN
jgi:hypothetical protein